MKRSIVFISFLVVFTLPALSAAEFYVIATGGPPVGTKIKSLPYTISQPGFYFVTGDLTCPAGTHGITINTDNVTLDLMGFRLNGPGGSGSYDGIRMSGRHNVEIRNGTIRYFPKYGINESLGGIGEGHRAINLRVRNNGDTGIYLSGKGNLVKDCTCFSNGGAGIVASEASTITGNTCYDNTSTGISGAGGGCTITGNTCYGNELYGIYASAGSTVLGNTCRSNLEGIHLEGNNFVAQNTATGNTSVNISDCVTCSKGLNHAP